MTTAIKVRVTRAMIRRGERAGLPCPVDLGVIAATEAIVSSVTLDRIRWSGKGEAFCIHRAPAPRSVRRFIARFDAGLPVKPFTFMLRTEPPP